MSIAENPDEPSPRESSRGSKVADGVSSPRDWRDLVRRIEEEKDPAKVIELAQQLVAMIDEEKKGRSLRSKSS